MSAALHAAIAGRKFTVPAELQPIWESCLKTINILSRNLSLKDQNRLYYHIHRALDMASRPPDQVFSQSEIKALNRKANRAARHPQPAAGIPDAQKAPHGPQP
jgi:hypothetical protein